MMSRKIGFKAKMLVKELNSIGLAKMLDDKSKNNLVWALRESLGLLEQFRMVCHQMGVIECCGGRYVAIAQNVIWIDFKHK